ncbi:MAG: acyl-CoA dehydrogenase [Deltaproteobacteria bacterium]|jgi:acyl-CoA dehydrogenase|nr:acyl-CoA dehydrogenase [Deltaproteobacteria bacterium]MBT4091791.1 acyl-CoA dehydrogenase [Deltaproteobacteria bacterium]MBT4264848.1 acyl-CoA dehydrogenase [Deltaproteobacteria bacterium]MBT6498834.1 acyl-CoA dehydrogenase [Deltaproteobacteria bacterium]MBT6615338.1 acyl-CoA dehydrogenase [Deltaproteobacteria bacterium]
MFSLEMSKEQKMIKDEVAKLVKNIVTENAADMEEKREIPPDAVQKAWELGASVSMVPEKMGGFGLEDSPITTAIILEELAYGDLSFAVLATLPSLIISPLINMGTESQKSKYLPLFCEEKFNPCTLAINEPHFGFEPENLKTVVEEKNGSYQLNGSKCFVPMAAQASHILVAASLEGTGNLFIIAKDNPGMKISELEENTGLRSLPTYEITFENCEIPFEDRLGETSGCDYEMFLQKTRIGMSAIGTGVSRASFEFAMNYSKDRQQFGEPIVHRQSVAFMIAEMGYEVEAMRLMTWKAASRLEAGKDAKREAYLAKLYAGEQTMKVVDYGVQLLGGHGYTKEYPVERYYRNGRGIGIIEGLATV